MRNGRLRQGRWGAAEFTATIISPIQRDAWGRRAAREGAAARRWVSARCRYVPHTASRSQRPHSNTFGSLAEQRNKFPSDAREQLPCSKARVCQERARAAQK